MTPAEQAVYDAYPTLAGQLLGATQALMHLPLDEMQTVASRVTLTGTLVGKSHGVKVDAAAAARQHKLIGLAIEYRDAALAISAEGSAT